MLQTIMVQTAGSVTLWGRMARSAVAMASARGQEPGRGMANVNVVQSTLGRLVISAVRDIIRASKMIRNCSVLPVINHAQDIVQVSDDDDDDIEETISDCVSGAGPKSCTVCASGYIMNTEHGCLVSFVFQSYTFACLIHKGLGWRAS